MSDYSKNHPCNTSTINNGGFPHPPAGGTVGDVLGVETQANTAERTQVTSTGGGVALGTTTSIASSLYTSHSDEFTVEIERKAERYRRQSLIRGLLPKERVATCYRFRVSKDSPVELHYSETRQRAYLGNLQVCGSVWGCPVCSSKISESRRLELVRLRDAVRAAAHSRFMVTYTLRHNAYDSLHDLNEKLTEARRRLKAGEYYQMFVAQHHLVGSVAAKEITAGEHGWHPHTHEIFMTASLPDELDRDGITRYFKERWQHLAGKLGFDASWEHGIDVRFIDDETDDDNFIDEYIAKFGYEPEFVPDRGQKWDDTHELAKQVSKVSLSKKGATPFQLAALHDVYLNTGELFNGRVPGSLFVEYFRALKGKNQLVWSRGLRLFYGLLEEEASDEEIATSTPEDCYPLANVTPLEWSLVVRYEKRAELVGVASRAGQLRDLSILTAYLKQLREYHTEQTRKC